PRDAKHNNTSSTPSFNNPVRGLAKVKSAAQAMTSISEENEKYEPKTTKNQKKMRETVIPVVPGNNKKVNPIRVPPKLARPRKQSRSQASTPVNLRDKALRSKDQKSVPSAIETDALDLNPSRADIILLTPTENTEMHEIEQEDERPTQTNAITTIVETPKHLELAVDKPNDTRELGLGMFKHNICK
ncbi:hypothetical protein RFI_09721, partial [Reticulomyxa filosa]